MISSPGKKIFGIGLSRTGTTSLHELLVTLGYRSIHFVHDLVDNPASEIVNAYDALMDTPIPQFYPVLDKKYPNSQFILTTRHKEKWLDSMKWLFTHGKVIWNWPESTHEYHLMFYGTRTFNKKILSDHFDNFHHQAFIYFKDRPQDLLCINIDEKINMDEIASFLNMPTNDLSFPKSNGRKYASFMSRLRYNWRHYTNS